MRWLLEFEGAARLRDQSKELKRTIEGSQLVKKANRTVSNLTSDCKRRKSYKGKVTVTAITDETGSVGLNTDASVNNSD